MKPIIAALFCLLSIASYAQLPPPFATNPNAVTDIFEWPPVMANDLRANPFTDAGNDGPTGFWLNYMGKPPSVYTLRTLGPAIVSRISCKRWAVVGHVQYWNVAAGSFLELENWFAPEKPGGPEVCYFSRTLADAGPLSKIEGSDDGHDFALPFDSTGAKTPLVRLVMKLHLAGSGRLGFSSVRLVQYPEPAATPTAKTTNAAGLTIINLSGGKDGPTLFSMHGAEYLSSATLKTAIQQDLQAHADAAFVLRGADTVPYASVKQALDTLREAGAKDVFFAASPTPTSHEPVAISPPMLGPPEWRSFLLGIGAACFSLVGAAAIFLLARRFNHLRHARELRRIASLDG